MGEQAKASRKIFVSLRLKLLLIFALLFLVVLIGGFIWFQQFTFNTVMDNIQRDLLALVETAAADMDGDAHTRLWQEGEMDDADYLAINAMLRAVKRTNPKASGMYTYVQFPDEPDQIRLVLSAAVPPGVEPHPRDVALVEESATGCRIDPTSRPTLLIPYSPPEEIGEDFFRGLREPAVTSVFYSDEYGDWYSAFAPFTNSEGELVGAVGVDMCVVEIVQTQNQIMRTMLIVFGITFLVLALAVSLVAYGVTRPIADLTGAAERIGGGDYDQDVSGLYRGKLQDEVSKMAQVFELMVDKVREREQKLRRQVADLQIMIDEGKKQKQVEEIVETDFFRDLRSQARSMRERAQRKSQEGEEGG